MAAVVLYNPRTGQPHTFPSKRSASVYERKGWTANKPSSSKQAKSSSGDGQSS